MAFFDEPYIASPPFPILEEIHNGWSAERRAKHAAAIRKWKPWEKSTGPRTKEGKARVAQNAHKHGRRSAQRRKFTAGLRHLNAMLDRQAQLHTQAARRLRALSKRKKTTNKLLDDDPTLTLLDRQIDKGAGLLLPLLALIMQKPCILDPPKVKT